jgi:hypothetical protein
MREGEIMESVIVWLLIVQLWDDPPPTIKFIYKKEYPTREECFEAKEHWEKKFVTLCSPIVKKDNTNGK